MEFVRAREFQRNEKLESLLREINRILEPAEDRILDKYRMPKYPVILIIGSPRCGSTLIMQWLAKTGKFAYPTNLLSRFYGAPHIGALIQQLLTGPEFNFNNEILEFNSEISFSSNLGKTRGALAPNEFWYFWRRFFPYGETQYLNGQSLARIDGATFAAELAAIESVFDKPLALKGLIINWNISYVSSILEKVLFIYVKRHPFYTIQSLLESRVRYFGDRRAWYSFKPPEYDRLKDMDPFEQVAGQVYFTNKAIEDGLSQIDRSRWLEVTYEDFCAFPRKLFHQILAKVNQLGVDVGDWSCVGTKRFQPTNKIRLPEKECKRVIESYKRFSGIDLTT